MDKECKNLSARATAAEISDQKKQYDSRAEPKVVIVILNWNGKNLTAECLESLMEIDYCNYKILLVDNGSTDGSQEYFRDRYPEIELVENGENLGFAEGSNVGVRRAMDCQADYVLLLNNDVEADPRLVGQVHDAIVHSGEGDFYACRMMDFYQRDLVDGAGDGFPKKGKSFRIGHGVKFGPPFDQSRRVFGACAGAGLYKRGLFEEVGLFDEDFFAYHEDVDWNFRANLMGYRCFYIPEAVVYHVGSGATGGLYNDFTVFHNVRNMIHVIIKDLPGYLLLKYLPWIVWGQIESFLRFCVVLGYWRAYFRGLSSAIRGSGKMLRKRREIQKRRRISLLELEQLLISSEQERKSRTRPI